MELLENPQAIILLVFMVIAGLKYVLENLKGKTGDEEQPQSFTELYEETREQIIERQHGEAAPQPGAGEEARQEAPQQLSILDFFGPPVTREKAPAPPSPPPLPAAKKAPASVAAAASKRETLSPAEKAALERIQQQEAKEQLVGLRQGRRRISVREMLATPSSTRDAIVLSEILGPPKGAL